MDFIFICCAHFLTLIYAVTSLDNGVALTPPMGWLSWGRFRCNTNCAEDPLNCISENLFINMADILVADGYLDAGYEFVNIDDCWMEKNRDKNGDMVADHERFPRGIKFLSDYMHQYGLKLGIYQDFGTYTCMGYPGIIGHMKEDAKKFVEWEVDMLKLDACHSHINQLEYGYTTMGKYLKEFSNRTILYSCSWPYYEFIRGIQPDFNKISHHCNMFRFYHDIEDTWSSIEQIIDFYGDNQGVFSEFIHPGSWSDPDMLMIGNKHLTSGQYRAQMAVWAMIPAPLLMSNDLRNIGTAEKSILLNRKLIAINQDIYGRPGKVIYKKNKLEIWIRSISEAYTGDKDTSYAVLFLNRHKNEKASIQANLTEFGLENKKGYSVTEIFTDTFWGTYFIDDTLNILVFPMDVIMLYCHIIL